MANKGFLNLNRFKSSKAIKQQTKQRWKERQRKPVKPIDHLAKNIEG